MPGFAGPKRDHREARGPNGHRRRIERDRVRRMAPPFDGDGREGGAGRREDDRDHREGLVESRRPDLPAEDEEDPSETETDSRELLDRQPLAAKDRVRDEGRLRRERREQDRGGLALDPVVLPPVDDSNVRGEKDQADEDLESPFG